MITYTNWLRSPFSSYLIKIWLSIWRHHLADLNILKLEYLWSEEIFENSEQHFPSHSDYLFMCQNGFNRKDAIFVLLPL